jgi:hypothetical protein
VLLVASRRHRSRHRPFHRCQRAARRKARLLGQRGAINQRPQRTQSLRVLLKQLLSRIEQRELQEALRAVALDARAQRLVHGPARVLRVEEERCEEERALAQLIMVLLGSGRLIVLSEESLTCEKRGDQRVRFDKHGLVAICTSATAAATRTAAQSPTDCQRRLGCTDLQY